MEKFMVMGGRQKKQKVDFHFVVDIDLCWS